MRKEPYSSFFYHIRCRVCGRDHKVFSEPSKLKNRKPPYSLNSDIRIFVCIKCERPVCESCTLDAAWYGILPFVIENEHPLCMHCFEKKEIKYIKNIPQKELPLYVNKNWISKNGKKEFLERFKVSC